MCGQSRAVKPCPTVSIEPAPRAIIGALQIPTDEVLDVEGPLLVSQLPRVQLLITKMQLPDDFITADTFLNGKDHVCEAVKTFRPFNKLNAIGLSCTSMSFVLGPDEVDSQIKKAHPAGEATDMARAQLAALLQLGAKKVALLTPYIEEVSLANAKMLASGGVEVVRRATMGIDSDQITCRVSQECIAEWVHSIDCEEADVIVIGCSAFRACTPGFIDSLEAKLKKPVVTSTQAFLWKLLRIAGIEDKISGYGVLFSEH